MYFLEILVPGHLIKISAGGGGLYGSRTLNQKRGASQVNAEVGQKFKQQMMHIKKLLLAHGDRNHWNWKETILLY